MKQLNYNHLYYFYLTAKEGSIAAASKVLHLTPQTISGQLTTLEDYLGIPLFDRYGKRLVLNDNGKLMYSYAEDIFNLGHELLQRLEPQQMNKQFTFTLGITDAIPKVITYDLIQPLFEDNSIKVVCKEGELEQLLASLALNKVDAVLSDRPIPPGNSLKTYTQKLTESGLSFFIASDKADNLQGEFPNNMNEQEFLLPGDQSSIKQALMSWLDDHQVHPIIIGEFDDSALTKLFGQSGYGIFCTPTIAEEHVLETYEVSLIGRTKELVEQFYLITSDRKRKHPVMELLNTKY